jgi:DNA repair exonuclease SbcCD ATPase subunit
MRNLLATSALAISLTWALAACTTTDPNQGGFFGGMGGLLSGNYERETQARRDALAAEQARNRDLRAQAAASQSERQQIAYERASLQQQVAALNNDINRLSGRLSAAEARKRNDPQLANLRAELAALERSVRLAASDNSARDPAGEAAKRRQIEELTRRKQQLESAIDQAAKS